MISTAHTTTPSLSRSLSGALLTAALLNALVLSGCTGENPDFNLMLADAPPSEAGSPSVAGTSLAGAQGGEAGATSGGEAGVEAGATSGVEAGVTSGVEAGVTAGTTPPCGDDPNDCDGDGVSLDEGDCDDRDPTSYPGAPEPCDGVDHNCDGAPSAEVRSCYTADEATLGLGACISGVQRCEGDAWGACEEEITPSLEACDGVMMGRDDDCDGVVDEGCDRDNDGVSVDQGDCDDLNPLVFPGAPDLCDGLNSDCDDALDEDLEPCYEGPSGTEGRGICMGGQLSCAEGVVMACEGQTLPQAERCGAQALDEDCDGVVDEGCDEASCEDIDLSTELSLSASCMIADTYFQSVVRLRPETLSGGPLPANVSFSLSSSISTTISEPIVINGEWIWVLNAPFADQNFTVTASARCGSAPARSYQNSSEIALRYAVTNLDGLQFGPCRAPQGNLLVTVRDAKTGQRIPGASVMVGEALESDWQPDPFAAILGQLGTADNTATTNAAGQAKFREHTGKLSGPFSVTVGAPGYEYVTVVDMNSPHLTLSLEPSEYPETPYFARGSVQSFDDTSRDGQTDLALVMPSITLRELSTINVSELLSRQQCWQPLSLLSNNVEVPSNLYIPRQNEQGRLNGLPLPFTINEHAYRVTDLALGVDNLVALGGKIPTQSALDALTDPSVTMADLLADVTFSEFGVRRNQTLSTSASSNNIAIPLDVALQSDASCEVSNIPSGAYATCLSAGAWPGQSIGSSRLFPMGIVNISSQDLAQGSATRPLTIVRATGDLTGISYVGAVLALFDDSDPAKRDAVSAVIKRGELNERGGTLVADDFFNPLIISRQGRTYSWTPAQNSNTPAPHICEIEVRRVKMLSYSPGGCAPSRTREISAPLWRAYVLGDPHEVTLPTPPAGWPRASGGGLLLPSELAADERLEAQVRCQRLIYSDDLNFENRAWGDLPLSHVTFNKLPLD